jgi:hypothetical protein
MNPAFIAIRGFPMVDCDIPYAEMDQKFMLAAI